MKFGLTRTSEWNDKVMPVESKKCFRGTEDGAPKWMIEVNSLSELMRFINEECEGLVVICNYGDHLPSIEIYDDYRE